MKAQICPACKKDAKEKHGFIPMASCQNSSCNLFEKWFTIAFWNTMRVAPDDEYVKGFIMNSKQCKVFFPYKIKMSAHFGTRTLNWMNPHWPERSQ